MSQENWQWFPIESSPKDIETRFFQLREDDNYIQVGDSYMAESYEMTHWMPIPVLLKGNLKDV